MECEEHGPAREAFVCEHLLQEPTQLWCSREPKPENPWPDSWCLKCDAEFQRHGEWNELNESSVPIKLVCHHCYARLRSQGKPWA